MDRRTGAVGFMILLLLILPGPPARAEYPEQPIRMINGWPAGGPADVMTRVLCDLVEKRLKQPIVVENMVGASGTKALAMVSSAAPDGYTLGHVVTTGITEKPHVMSVSYDPLKGFTPIMFFGWYTYAACVRKDAPWKTFKEFIEYARANPGKIKYGSGGFKSTQHIWAERLQMLVPGLKMVAIPLQSGGPSMMGLLGGHVDAAFLVGECKPYVESGELRMLAALNSKRWKSFPDIPTVLELGYPVATEAGIGIVAPPGLPPAVRAKLQESFHEAMKDKNFLATMHKFEMILDYMSGAEMEVFLKRKFEETAKTVNVLPK